MKTFLRLRRTLASFGFVFAGLALCVPSAQASIDDFIKVYQQIESVAPSGTLPVSSQDIITYKDLFTCIEGGSDVVVCTNDFHNTHAGQQASDQADIPEGVWQAVEAYVAWKEGDTWGVVEHLGAAAACAVLQVLAGGTDICGLIQDLYDAAVAAYDTAKWVANFFASLGEGAWSVVSAIGCELGLGGCDSEPPPPPPEVSAYNQFFAPKIKDGSALQARESSNPNAFGTLVNQVSSAAQKKYSFAVVMKASDAFTTAVGKLWTADIPTKVLPGLAAKRDAYNNAGKDQNVSAAVKDAGAAYAASKADPKDRAVKHCLDDFAEFLHYDYWSARPEYQILWKQFGSSPTNADWCLSVFWYKNNATFAKYFRGYVEANLCPTLGQQLMCSALPKYQSCLALMGSVGKGNQCGVVVAQAGYDAAVQVNNVLHQDTAGIKKSTIPCQIVHDSAPLSTKPAQLVCPRPVQQYYCKDTYKTLFGSLPVKLLDCTPGPLDPNYTALVSKVQTALSTTIPKSHPALQAGALVKDQIDPLIVGATNVATFNELRKTNQNFGFGPPSSKPGFEYLNVLAPPRTKDGVNTPIVFYQHSTQFPVQKARLGQVMQPDPAMRTHPSELATKPAAGKLGIAKTPAAKAPATGGGFVPRSGPEGQAGGFAPRSGSTGAGGGFVPRSGSANMATAQGATGAAGQSLPAPTKPLSGSAPAGISNGRLSVTSAQAEVESNCRSPLPAITVKVKIRNEGGLPAGGGATIRVREIGGTTSLSSAAIPLPVLKAGESRDLSIQVATPRPYASLPGMHRLGVYLTPKSSRTLAPHQVSVNVPAGHCGSTLTRPGPSAVPRTRQ